jgi:hypothetical protein
MSETNSENMKLEHQSDNTLRNTRPDLVDRVTTHLGPEFADMPVSVAAQFDTGDLEDSDPRSRAANIQQGRFTAEGGSGPVRG